MLRIRLRRVGKKGNPSYRIVVAESSSPRDGAYLEWIGNYDPMADPPAITIKEDRAAQWLSKGAQPSDAVARILDKSGLFQRTEEFRTAGRKSGDTATAVAAPPEAPTVTTTATPAAAAEEAPAEDAPADEPATEEAAGVPVDEAPAEAEAPVDEAPTEAPAEEGETAEAPAEEEPEVPTDEGETAVEESGEASEE